MSRSNNIKWRKSDFKRLKNEIRNFNNRVKTFEKNNGKNIINEASFEEIYNKITTRNEFNKVIRRLNKFKNNSKQSEIIENQFGVKKTKWEINNLKNDLKIYNKKMNKKRSEIEKIELTSRGMSTLMRGNEMGSEEYNSARTKTLNFEKIRSNKEFNKLADVIETRILYNYDLNKMDSLKENYLKGIINSDLSKYYNELKDIINRIDNQVFYQVFLTEIEAKIDFIYDPHDAEVKFEILKSIWESV